MISFASLFNSPCTGGPTTFTGGSVSPAANTVHLLWVLAYGGLANDPVVPSVSGNGLAWQYLTSSDNGINDRAFLFLGYGPAPTTGPITVDFGSMNISFVGLSLVACSGVDTTNGGRGAIVRTLPFFSHENVNNTEITVGLVNPTNVIVGSFGAHISSALAVSDANTTLISSSSNTISIASVYGTANGGDLHVKTGSGSTAQWANIAVELQAIDVGSPIPSNKRYCYMVYNSNTYIGNLPNVVSDFSFTQDINTAGGQLEVDCAVSADIAAQTPDFITDQAGAIIQDEAGNNLTNERASDIVGNASSSVPIQNGNRVVVWEYSTYHPNGQIVFQGQINRYEATYGQTSADEIVKVFINSDGQELNNAIALGNPYTTDQSQLTHPSAFGSYNRPSGGSDFVGQVFTTGGTITNIAAIDVFLHIHDTSSRQVTLSLYTSVAAANAGTAPLASSSQLLPTSTNGVVKFAFSAPVTASSLTSYFFTITFDQSANNSSSIDVGFNAAPNPGGLYLDGTVNGGSWKQGVTSPDGIPGDLYYVTYTYNGQTSATFTLQDPSTGILQTIINNYTAQGGRINYAAGTVDATGLSLTYTFNTNTVLEAVSAVLRLSPYNYYWYVDVGSNVLYFKQTGTSANYTLIKGRHLTAMTLIATIENLINKVYFSGGLVGPNNLFSTYTDQTSISRYGVRIDRQSDNRVTVQASADAIGNSEVAEFKNEAYQTEVTVLDTMMDISQFKPGQIVGFAGFGTFVDGLLLQIVRVQYGSEQVTLTLGQLPPRMNKTVAQSIAELIALQTIANPASPTGS